MTPIDQPAFHAEIASRLDPLAVEAAADQVRDALWHNRTVAVDYCPGNSTRYVLVIAPAEGLRGDDVAVWGGVGFPQDVVVVSHLNGVAQRCHAFALDPAPEVPYLQDKLMVGVGDAVAIQALLLAASTGGP